MESFQEITWQRFDQLTRELAARMGRNVPELVIGIAKGGVFVGGALAALLRCDFVPVRISRRSRDRVARRRPRVFGKMPAEVKGKRVLVVDDVVASGETLKLACAQALAAGAREAKSAALVVRESAPRPDWFALETSDLVVFPWDYDVIDDGRFETDPEAAGA
ncbi:MAG TPA: phosphoribosyltransferase [Myxococcales bacterium]|nr:phosphoribosyltransferase [Myxococcales bacterium]